MSLKFREETQVGDLYLRVDIDWGKIIWEVSVGQSRGGLDWDLKGKNMENWDGVATE